MNPETGFDPGPEEVNHEPVVPPVEAAPALVPAVEAAAQGVLDESAEGLPVAPVEVVEAAKLVGLKLLEASDA